MYNRLFYIYILSIISIITACKESSTTINKAPQLLGAKIKIEEAQKEKDPVKDGISNITIHFDGDMVNRINQRRDTDLIKIYPEMFGDKKEFLPLLTIEACGEGTILVKGGRITKNIQIPINTKITQKVEVFPDYELENLFAGQEGEEEKIEIDFKNNKGIIEKIDSTTIKWSSPTELFLSDKNRSDISSFIKENTKILKNNMDRIKNFESKEALLLDVGKEIINKEIKYDNSIKTNEISNGWQKIKTIEEIEKNKTANCLDISTYIASKASYYNYKSFILFVDGHAFVGVASKNEDIGNAMFIEGTALLNGKTTTVDTAISTANEFIKSKKIDDNYIAEDISGWFKFYRESTNNF